MLGDPEKRKLYDEFGMAGVQAGFDPNRAREAQSEARRWQESAGRDGGYGGYSNFEDIFGDIFRGREEWSAAERGADFESELEIDLLDAVRGLSTTISLARPQRCGECGGSGLDPASVATCPDCNGQGTVRVGKGPVAFSRRCPRCGTGARASRASNAGAPVEDRAPEYAYSAGVDNGSRACRRKGGSEGGREGDSTSGAHPSASAARAPRRRPVRICR